MDFRNYNVILNSYDANETNGFGFNINDQFFQDNKNPIQTHSVHRLLLKRFH